MEIKIEASKLKNEVGKIGDNVIIKSTRLQSKIKKVYGMMKVEFSLPKEMVGVVANHLSYSFDAKKLDKVNSNKDGWIYLLINDIEYHEDDLIIGDINIREYKINQINGI